LYFHLIDLTLPGIDYVSNLLEYAIQPVMR